MKHIFIISLLSTLFLSIAVKGQSKFLGTIRDTHTQTALSGVKVSIPDLNLSTVSDSLGRFIIKNIPDGTYLIKAEAFGYAPVVENLSFKGTVQRNYLLKASHTELKEVIVTGVASAMEKKSAPYSVSTLEYSDLLQGSSTNVIDVVAKVPGVSAITDGQSISKPVIRGLGYNRVLTINDGAEQVDQPWFDEFGIEADPDAVNRYEVLKGPASLAYGSDAIAGVINLIPEQPSPEGQIGGEILYNYQTNNGLNNAMLHLAGSQKNIYWSARVDNTMAHAYQNPNDGYVLNSQFSNFNWDGTIGSHAKWGYTQLHVSYFDMHTGIVDGTRDSTSGVMERQVAYPGLNGGAPTYVLPTHQEQTSYTPFVIDQHIRHTKIVWDNSIKAGDGHIKGTFSWQKNQRQENNDPTIPNVSDIYYASNAVTYDMRYISSLINGWSYSSGVNGVYQDSKSLGTLMLIPNYNFFEIGAFAIVNKKLGKLNLSGGLRYDTRIFNGADHWVDSTNQAPVRPNALNAFHEFQGFTSHFSGMSFSVGGTYDVTKNVYVKANVARGWRAPNVAECAANGVHDGTVVYEIGDHTLKPETSLEEDMTFGVSSKNVNLELNLFNNHINDFIYARGLKTASGADSINNSLNAAGLGAAPVYKYTQGAATLYGGEFAFNIHPQETPWLEFYSTLSMVYGGLQHVSDSTKYLPFVPPTRITADVKFNLSPNVKCLSNVYIKAGLLSCFEQKDIYQQYAIYNGLNTAITPYEYAASKAAAAGYTLFNVGVGGNILSNGKEVCKLYLLCNNLFNTAYIDYMSRFKYYPVNYTTGRVGVYNMGRNISIKALIPLRLSQGK